MSKLTDLLEILDGSPGWRSDIEQYLIEAIGPDDIAATFNLDGTLQRFGRPDAAARNQLRAEIRERLGL